MKLLHLVVDEVVPVDQFKFRLQVWRNAGLAPVVVCIQVPGQPAPKAYTTKLAQIAVQRFLGYSTPLPTFFHYGTSRKAPQALKVTFSSTGNPLRPILCGPTYAIVDPVVLERVFGLQPIPC
jgi:hypothetical protein